MALDPVQGLRNTNLILIISDFQLRISSFYHQRTQAGNVYQALFPGNELTLKLILVVLRAPLLDAPALIVLLFLWKSFGASTVALPPETGLTSNQSNTTLRSPFPSNSGSWLRLKATIQANIAVPLQTPVS